jgi:hypothetical protein
VHDERLARDVDEIASDGVTHAYMLPSGAAMHESFIENRPDPYTLQQMEVPLYSTGSTNHSPTQAIHSFISVCEASGNSVFFQKGKAESPRATLTVTKTQNLLRVHGDL